MKLKYYLRGLGIGILVTAVIMSISSGRREQMSDEEIKARARELGMVESRVLSDIPSAQPEATSGTEDGAEADTPESDADAHDADASEEEGETETETGSPETDHESEAEAESGTPDVSEPDVSASEAEGGSAAEEAEATPGSPADGGEHGGSIVVTVSRGQSSVTVSRMLEEAGLVASASEFDRYLCTNGYDKRIQTGTYEIPAGTAEEEIARMITGDN